jgi:hypothetical protein
LKKLEIPEHLGPFGQAAVLIQMIGKYNEVVDEINRVNKEIEAIRKSVEVAGKPTKGKRSSSK